MPTSTWHTGALPLWAVPPPLTFPVSSVLGKANLVTCPSCHCAPGHMGTLMGTRASYTSLLGSGHVGSFRSQVLGRSLVLSSELNQPPAKSLRTLVAPTERSEPPEPMLPCHKRSDAQHLHHPF